LRTSIFKPSLYFFSLVLLIFIGTGVCAQNVKKTDSLRAVLKLSATDTNRVKSLNALALEFRNKDKDTSIVLSTQALELAQNLNWKSGIATSCHQLGLFNHLKSNYAEALGYYSRAVTVLAQLEKEAPSPQKTFFLNRRGSTLNNMGIIYRVQGDYPKALDHYLKALRIKEELGKKAEIAHILNGIGLACLQTDPQKSMGHYLKSLELYSELKDSAGIATVYGNIGLVYFDQAKKTSVTLNNGKRDSLFNKSREYQEKALTTDENLGNTHNVARHLGNIGAIYFYQAPYTGSKTKTTQTYSLALHYYLKALAILETLGDKNLIAQNHANIGSLYGMLGQYDKAETYLKKALSVAREMGTLESIKGNQQNLSDLYTLKGNYALALEYYKAYVQTRDSIYNEENTKKTVQSQMNYEFDKKEAITRAEQEKKDLLAKEEIKKQALIRNSFICGFVFILLLALLIYRSYRNKQKVNLIILKQKEEVERSKQVIEQQKTLVEQKQKEVLDSIHYAQRIQNALITSERFIEKNLNRLSGHKS